MISQRKRELSTDFQISELFIVHTHVKDRENVTCLFIYCKMILCFPFSACKYGSATFKIDELPQYNPVLFSFNLQKSVLWTLTPVIQIKPGPSCSKSKSCRWNVQLLSFISRIGVYCKNHVSTRSATKSGPCLFHCITYIWYLVKSGEGGVGYSQPKFE